MAVKPKLKSYWLSASNG